MINIGDHVTIRYAGGRLIHATVLNVPQQTGEMWIFRVTWNSTIIYQNPMSAELDCIIKETHEKTKIQEDQEVS